VNTLEADTATAFNGMASSSLASWALLACSVQESFNAWPASYTPVAYDTIAAPADFTASDGATGQPYVLLGSPISAATAALAPSAGGEVPAGTTAGGGPNPAAPGVVQAAAGDPVDTENGDFSQSATDVSIPTFGPSLDFTRAYDAGLAQQETQAGTPGALGYGWTDNWASSLTLYRPVPGDIYTVDGTGTGTSGDGGPAPAAGLGAPDGVATDARGDIFIADTGNNRIQEIAASRHSQWGISMTAGDVYTVAGSATGQAGIAGDAGPAASALLRSPSSVSLDAAGNLYIADTGNSRIQEVPAVSGAQRGTNMTAGDIYTVAGSAVGTRGFRVKAGRPLQRS
jgi:hypothetical protein